MFIRLILITISIITFNYSFCQINTRVITEVQTDIVHWGDTVFARIHVLHPKEYEFNSFSSDKGLITYDQHCRCLLFTYVDNEKPDSSVVSRKISVNFSYKDKDSIYKKVEEIKYLIFKTEIIVSDGSVSRLYKGVAKKLLLYWNNEIDFPSQFECSFKGGKILVSDKNNKEITILPEVIGQFIAIRFNDTFNRFSDHFEVVNPPELVVEVLPVKRNIDLSNGIPILFVGSIKVKIKPDPYFERCNPEEANYAVSGITYVISRNEIIIKKGNISDKSPNISLKKCRPGDILTIEIPEVRRINSFGDSIQCNPIKYKVSLF